MANTSVHDKAHIVPPLFQSVRHAKEENSARVSVRDVLVPAGVVCHVTYPAPRFCVRAPKFAESRGSWQVTLERRGRRQGSTRIHDTRGILHPTRRRG